MGPVVIFWHLQQVSFIYQKRKREDNTTSKPFTMRLRLCVYRHELPPTKLLWNVPKPHLTIAELLDQLNDVVPLEAEGWGFEDYAVQVGSYEALHFQTITDILKDEDEVM